MATLEDAVIHAYFASYGYRFDGKLGKRRFYRKEGEIEGLYIDWPSARTAEIGSYLYSGDPDIHTASIERKHVTYDLQAPRWDSDTLTSEEEMKQFINGTLYRIENFDNGPED